ncbi:MAG: tRNA pseudouridine(55) synthase TruB [Actinobacteria bacterium]|nr:tRNA pseudouridine(55) synthase TruB [Actinomycetota bacterium]
MESSPARPLSAHAELAGFLNVYKPAGMRSTQALCAIRRATEVRRAGHCGTLDPLAEGVLPIALGGATRLAAQTLRLRKSYFACVLFGVTTTTDDLEGRALGSLAPSPSAAEVADALTRMTGVILQRPPTISAIHVGGERAYARARRGEAFDLPAREVTIHAVGLRSHGTLPVAVCNGSLRFGDGPGASEALVAGVWVTCTAGTYMRSLARDLGAQLGSGATLFGLIRLAVGPFSRANATEIWQVAQAARHGYLETLLFPPDAVVEDLPAQIVGPAVHADLVHGRPASAPPGVEGLHRLYAWDGAFVGLGQAANSLWVTRQMFRSAA